MQGFGHTVFYGHRHMWTLPAGKGFVERICKMVGCGHMYGLLVRFMRPRALMEVRRSGPNHIIELEALTTPRVFLIPARPVCITSFITLPKLRTPTRGGAQPAAGAGDR